MNKIFKKLCLALTTAFLLGGCALLGLNGGDTAGITLRISEVGCAYYQEDPVFIEIYNYGSETVDLGDCVLRSSAALLGSITLYEGEFELPSHPVEPGAFVLIRADVNAEPTEHGAAQVDRYDEISVSAGGYFPYWTNMGFAELTARGQSVDFVRWGSGGIANPTTGSFESSAPGTSYVENYYFVKSIARADEADDTDSGMDWDSTADSTPGKTNIEEDE
ncbi:MAG: hypothetical protein B6241_13840 [Spirochaetaceae bacterium 4572_59]|nr:MAG: hypothetical protein B6241_13840 [Spirochaetaceae bacterium 4572_59]